MRFGRSILSLHFLTQSVLVVLFTFFPIHYGIAHAQTAATCSKDTPSACVISQLQGTDIRDAIVECLGADASGNTSTLNCKSSTVIGGEIFGVGCDSNGCAIVSAKDKSILTAEPNYIVGSTYTEYTAAGEKIGGAVTGKGKVLAFQALLGPVGLATAAGTAIADAITGNTSETGTLKDKGVSEAESRPTCELTNILSMTCLISGLSELVAGVESVILFIAAAILGLANYLLSWTVYITVYQFGKLIGNSEGLLAAWGVIRDLANILLLFGFIFMGIATILNLPHSEFTAKKALPTLIIFAILLNFSLVAVEGVIDVSNAFATSIYDQISGDQVCSDGDSSARGCAFDQGIGGRLMQMSGVSGIWNLEGITGNSGDGNAPAGTTKAIIYAGLIIFVVITTIVIFAAAVMLIIRALILAFLMVTSPIGFAGMAIPPLQEMARKWWKQLFDQAIFAPVYFILTLVSFKIMEGVIAALDATGDSAASAQTLASVFSASVSDGRVSNITVVITFVLIIGFMIASLMFAKRSSALGSTFAIGAGASMSFGLLSKGTNLAYGGSAFALRRAQQTRVGQRLTGPVGKFAVTRVLTPLETSNLDIRRMPGVASVLGGVAGIPSAALEPSEHGSIADIKHEVQDIAGRKEGKRRGDLYDKQVAGQNVESGLHSGSLTPDQERALARMTIAEIEALHAAQAGDPTLGKVLSTQQFKEYMKSEKINNDAKERVAEARFEQVAETLRNLAANPADWSKYKDEIRDKWSNEDLSLLAKYNSEMFGKLITTNKDTTKEMLISKDQFESLKKSDSLTNTQRETLINSSQGNQLIGIINNATIPAAARTQMVKDVVEDMKGNAADLPAFAIKNPDVMAAYNKDILAAIQSKNRLTEADRNDIYSAINNANHANYASIQTWLNTSRNARAYWTP